MQSGVTSTQLFAHTLPCLPMSPCVFATLESPNQSDPSPRTPSIVRKQSGTLVAAVPSSLTIVEDPVSTTGC